MCIWFDRSCLFYFEINESWQPVYDLKDFKGPVSEIQWRGCNCNHSLPFGALWTKMSSRFFVERYNVFTRDVVVKKLSHCLIDVWQQRYKRSHCAQDPFYFHFKLFHYYIQYKQNSILYHSHYINLAYINY